jgi:long-chain acyl-CoA synthetase
MDERADEAGDRATVVDWLERAAARRPAAPAVHCEGVTLGYGELARARAALADRLVALGARGRPVLIALPNSLELVLAIHAAHAAGAQACTVNPEYTAREFRHVVEDAEPAVVIHAGLPALASVLDPATPSLVPGPDAGSWLAALLDGASPRVVAPAGDAIATLQYTGGTTGRPKGVMLTHRAIATNVRQREAWLPTRLEDERVLCFMPLYHTFAVAMALHLALYARGTLVVLPRYRPAAVLDALVRHRITRLPAGPTVYAGLLASGLLRDADLGTLRSAYSGSAPLPVSTLAAWDAATRVPVFEGYGQTEAGPVLTYQSVDRPRQPGSVGRPLPGTELEIVDPQDGRHVLPAGEVGEVRARGPQLMSGYRGRPEETAAALRDGWLYTGDLGRIDERGELRIEDRKKDMVIVGGYNVYPREVEDVLLAHPDVAEAAVYGVADAYRGEVVHATVVARAGHDLDLAALEAHCAAGLVRYKRPVRLVQVEALPRTAVGKIDRGALRAGAAG